MEAFEVSMWSPAIPWPPIMICSNWSVEGIRIKQVKQSMVIATKCWRSSNLCCSSAKNAILHVCFEILKPIKSQTENMTQSSFRTSKSRQALSLWPPTTILVLVVGIFGCWSLRDPIWFVWCRLSGNSRRASYRRAGLHSAQSVLGHRLWMSGMYLWIIEIWT